jgi:hypothetical protein
MRPLLCVFIITRFLVIIFMGTRLWLCVEFRAWIDKHGKIQLNSAV